MIKLKGNVFRLIQFLWLSSLLSIVPLSTSHTSLPTNIDPEAYLQMESDMILKLRNHFTHEHDRLKTLKTHLEDWKKWRKSYSKKKSKYITIPQNIFHLFKKLTIDLENLQKIMLENSYNDTMSSDSIQPPTDNHLKAVAMSLVDQQYFHDMKPKDIIEGRLPGLQLNISLDLDTCYFIGKTCVEFNEHLCARDWLSTFLTLAPEDERRKDVVKMLYPSFIFLNDTQNAFTYANKYLSHDPYDIPARDVALKYGSRLEQLNYYDLATVETFQLCRGENIKIQPNLRCRYKHESSPFLKIAPLKEEVLHNHPKILLYRDIVHDSEIKIMKSWAATNMKVATVVGKDGKGGYKGFNYRISETGFLDNKLPALSMLTKRIEDMSDLSIHSSEMWQLLNYSPGGFYAMHSDYLPHNAKDVERLGNRMTSILFYLNDVTLGGETAFPRLRLAVKPIKGTAILWYNVHADGSQNNMVDHSACPVVIGEKWGFTQWIRSLGQKCLREIYKDDPTISWKVTKKSKPAYKRTTKVFSASKRNNN